MVTLRQVRWMPCACLVLRTSNPQTIAHSRTFFKFPSPPSLSGIGNKVKKYSERRLIGFTDQQMFDVVSQVDKYPEFVPWCTRVVVKEVNDDFVGAKMEIGFPPVVEKYTAAVTLDKPKLVKSVCTDGRLFNHLVTTWRFSQGPDDNPRSCVLDFDLAHVFFDEVVKTMVVAFLKRAEKLHGPPSFDHFRQRRILAKKR